MTIIVASSQTIATLLKAKKEVFAEFLAAADGPDRQARFEAWNSLNHAIRTVQRNDGETRKQPASATAAEGLYSISAGIVKRLRLRDA
jgi:hypothetical protein